MLENGAGPSQAKPTGGRMIGACTGWCGYEEEEPVGPLFLASLDILQGKLLNDALWSVDEYVGGNRVRLGSIQLLKPA